MGRVTGGERRGCWEVLCQASVLGKACRNHLEGQRSFIALLQPRSEESTILCSAFYLYLCCLQHCSLTVAFLFSCAPSCLQDTGAEICTPLSKMRWSSQLCTCSGPQPWLLHWIAHKKRLLPLCEPPFLSFPLHPLFWGFSCTTSC